MTSKTQYSFFIKSQKQNNQNKYNNSFKKKNKTIFVLKKNTLSGRSDSSVIVPEEHFFRKVLPEQVFPELPEEPLMGLPEDSAVSHFPHFFRRLLLSSSTLRFR